MKTRALIVGCVLTASAVHQLHGVDVWSYSEETKTLCVSVPSGTTNVLDDALDPDGTYRGYLTANAVTNFVKKGDGALRVDLDLSAYTGGLTVEKGTYIYTNPKALGKPWINQGDVTVRSGATLNAHRLASATKNDWGVDGIWLKRIMFEGTGVDGCGALVFTREGGAALTCEYFSGTLVMTGDATIYNASDSTLRMYGSSYYHVNLDMNGYTLTLDGSTTGSAWSCLQIADAGQITVRRKRFALEHVHSAFNGSAENVISFEDGGDISFNKFGGPCGWTLDARNLKSITVIDGAAATTLNKTNSLWGGNILTGTRKLPVFYDSAVCNFTVGGIVSGAGLHVYTSWRGGYNFGLTGDANTFTDGLSVVGQSSAADKLGHLYVHTDGAVPAEGGPLSLTNATVTLNAYMPYSLPALVAHRTTAVIGGLGAWNGNVTKTGTGELEWDSLTGGEVLDVREGTVVVRDRSADRAQFAGLVEGTPLFRSDAGKAQESYGTAPTNRVTLSPAAMYETDHEMWTTPVPEGMKHRIFNYKGYIWNNSSETQTWSFALYVGTHSHLTFGSFATGTAVKDVDGLHFYNGDPKFATVDLPPGGTPIQLSGYYTASCGLKSTSDKWKKAEFGVGYNTGNVASSDVNDYEALVDPGDGSLFTWALPDQVVENVTMIPGTSVVVRRAPYFSGMRFAKGTGICFDRGWYSVPELDGLPAVTGITDALTVTSRFGFSVPEVVEGNRMTVSGAFVLGPGAVIDIEDLDAGARGRSDDTRSFAVVEAAGGVTLPDDVSVTGSTGSWKADIAVADGKLLLVLRRCGLNIVVR